MDAILLLPVQWYWSPLLSFATLLVLSGLVWWSSRSSIRAYAHTLITIFQIHFTHHPVFIGSYSLFIAYLWVEGHQNHLAKRMNINLSTQQCGRARTEGMFVCICACVACVCLCVCWFWLCLSACVCPKRKKEKEIFMPQAASPPASQPIP